MEKDRDFSTNTTETIKYSKGEKKEKKKKTKESWSISHNIYQNYLKMDQWNKYKM